MTTFQAQLLVGDGYAVISLQGELDLGTVGVLRAAVEDLRGARVDLVVVDCSALQFIDSTGLSAIVSAHKQLLPLGVRIVIANLPSRLYRPVGITGLAKVIPTHVSDEPRHPWAEGTSPEGILTALGFHAGVPTARGPILDGAAKP